MKVAVIGGKGPSNQPWGLPTSWEYEEVREVSELEAHGDVDLIIDLAFVPDKDRIRQLSRMLPIPVMINCVIYTLKEVGQPFIRVNGWPGMLEREVIEVAVSDGAGALPEELCKHWRCRIVPDVPGMVSGRILASIINEAYYTLQEEVSTKEEIDTAMRLGTNYPLGPFEWSEKIGLKNIYDLLNILAATDSRYLPSRVMSATVGEGL